MIGRLHPVSPPCLERELVYTHSLRIDAAARGNQMFPLTLDRGDAAAG